MSHKATQTSLLPTDDPEAGSTWIVSLASIIILTVLVIATCVFYFKFERKEVDIKVIEPANAWMLGLKTAQLGELGVYQKYTVTASDGSAEPRIRIPVTKAMEFLVAEAKDPPKAVVIAPIAPIAPVAAGAAAK